MKISELKEPYRSMALANQKLQGNEPDESIQLGQKFKNFDWSKTKEGPDFWWEVNFTSSSELTPEIKANYPDIFPVEGKEAFSGDKGKEDETYMKEFEAWKRSNDLIYGNYRKPEEKYNNITMRDLLNLLAAHKGSIVSTASLSVEDIEQAKASKRMFVDNNSLGYVWQPDFLKLPETPEEVEQFEKWYPLDVKLPKELESCEWLFTKRINPKDN